MKAIYIAGRLTERPVAQRAVRTIMSSPVASVSMRATLDEALHHMVAARVRHLVVLDDVGEYGGVISDREIGAAWADDPGCLANQAVSSIVDRAAPTVHPTAQIMATARVMRAAGTDAVAVTDTDGTVLGVVTGTDLIGVLARYP